MVDINEEEVNVVAIFSLLVIVFLVLVTIFFGTARKAEAGCFVVVAGREATVTGRVALGHNEDNRGELIMRHHYIPSSKGLGGRMLSFEPGAAKIPQVDETFGFFWTETLRPAPGESFADSFVNEKGLAVVSNTCCKSREDAPDLTDGGIGWGLRRLVAERASTAREAVDVAAELVLRYGYRAPGRSYVFADCREAWVFQVVNGRHYAARRIPDDHVLVNPNHYSIREMNLQNSEQYLASPGLVEYAIRRGWYQPAKEGDYTDFDFAEAYQHPDYIMTSMNVARHLFGFTIAAQVPVDIQKYGGRMPFSLPPAMAISLPRIYRTLSNHCERPTEGEGLWTESPHLGGGITATENRHDEYTRICNGATRESLLIDLHEDPRRTVIWSCFGNPCTLLMTPWHLGAEGIPESFCGGSSAMALSGHFDATEEELIDAVGEAWLVSRTLVDYCDGDYARRSILLKPKLAEAQREIRQIHADFEENLSAASPSRDHFFKQAEEQAKRAVEAMRRFTEE